MGLSIHYSGTIRNVSLIDQLIDETSDVCASMDWKYNVIKESGDNGVNGIVFSPKNCEPVFLTFLTKGRMCSPINPGNKEFYSANGLDPELVYTTSTKTQFAGPDAHIALLKLLKYLSKKYFETFELNDEGYYWGTEDEKILLQRFTHYNNILNAVKDVLTGMPYQSGEDVNSLANRIEEAIKRSFGEETGN